MPVAGGDLRQQREHRVAEVAVARDHLPRLAGEEPVRLGVVDVAARDRAGQHLEVVGVHLRVARHHGGDVDLVVARLLVAGDDRAADAEVALVLDQLDARVGQRAHRLDGAVGGAVVDDVDAVDELRDPADRLRDQLLLVVRGDDDRHALAFQHASRLGVVADVLMGRVLVFSSVGQM